MSAESVRVAVDSQRCIGGGQCEMLEPEVFLVDDDEAISSVIGSGVLPRPRAETVVHRCPGAAVSVVGPEHAGPEHAGSQRVGSEHAESERVGPER